MRAASIRPPLRLPLWGAFLILVAATAIGDGGAAPAPEPGAPGAPDAAPGGKQVDEVEVPPPPFSEGIFPCSECHADMEPNPERRELEDEHEDIVLRHDEQHRWCLDCHDAADRDQLRLASGKRVPFSRSYLLCGQCHGNKLRDWRAGVHGKRTGHWNGPRRYLLCAHCHDPHQPAFKPIAPEPPPERPVPAR